ncbi:HlyU family transcriptional regulator [Pseudoroseicyclus sp. H15]
MGLFSKLFGGRGGDAPAGAKAEPERYEGFAIYPEPMREGNKWRIAARIEKDGRVHQLIRADTLESEEAAVQASLGKAKLMIDQMGERIFD